MISSELGIALLSLTLDSDLGHSRNNERSSYSTVRSSPSYWLLQELMLNEQTGAIPSKSSREHVQNVVSRRLVLQMY